MKLEKVRNELIEKAMTQGVVPGWHALLNGIRRGNYHGERLVISPDLVNLTLENLEINFFI